MIGVEVIHNLRSRGFTVSLEGENIRLHSAVTPDSEAQAAAVEIVRVHKTEVIEALRPVESLPAEARAWCETAMDVFPGAHLEGWIPERHQKIMAVCVLWEEMEMIPCVRGGDDMPVVSDEIISMIERPSVDIDTFIHHVVRECYAHLRRLARQREGR